MMKPGFSVRRWESTSHALSEEQVEAIRGRLDAPVPPTRRVPPSDEHDERGEQK